MAAVEVHVLMVTLPFQGHMNPMLRFAKRLASKGLHVTLATVEVAPRRWPNGSVSIVNGDTVNGNPKIELQFFSDGLTLDVNRAKYADLLFECLPSMGSKSLSNLITKLGRQGRKFSCIINQPFVPWVADVAADHDIPCAMLYIQAFSLYAIYHRHHVYKLENPNQASFEVPGLPLLEANDLPTFILPSSPRHLRKLVSDSVQSMDKVKWVLVNSFYELEADVVQSMAPLFNSALPIGPLVHSVSVLPEKEESNNTGACLDMWKAEESCLEWLDKRAASSVVYLAFGSATVLSQKQMQNIAMALKSSKRPFLWVAKPPETDSETQNAGLPIGFLEECSGRGVVVSWCPQERVLMHQAVACFMSHCGWNSTVEAVAAGIPVVAIPDCADQPTNAKLIVDVFKMGVRMRCGEDGIATKEEVERCIDEITEGPRAGEIRKRAMQLREAARKAVADGGSSDRNIDDFITQITTQI